MGKVSRVVLVLRSPENTKHVILAKNFYSTL